MFQFLTVHQFVPMAAEPQVIWHTFRAPHPGSWKSQMDVFQHWILQSPTSWFAGGSLLPVLTGSPCVWSPPLFRTPVMWMRVTPIDLIVPQSPLESPSSS